ncbi:MAG: hypothetical protein JW810_08180 [Sedimentisphaerales bacterium]|nr:hypothetical protein [Sedimentisphaerales bacterium]
MNIRRITLALVGLFLLAGSGPWGGVSWAQDIPPGTDLYRTVDETAYLDFGPTSTIGPIPADFFGPGSDPFDGIIALRSNPVPDYCAPVDTVMERLETAPMPGPSQIAVQLTLLSLKSTSPVEVMYMTGEIHLYDVYVTLNPDQVSAGQMTIEETADGGGGMYGYHGELGGIMAYLRLQFVEVFPTKKFQGEPVIWDLPNPVRVETQNLEPWQRAEPVGTCYPGQGFYPVPEQEIELLLDAGLAGKMNLLPIGQPATRVDDFWVMVNMYGQVVEGGGSGFNNGEWYFYDQTAWWNEWFYDHPFDSERKKVIKLTMNIQALNPGAMSFVEVVYNWSTPEWPPGQPQPPIPPLPAPEEVFIARSEPIFAFEGPLPGPDTEPILVVDEFEIPDYNPEWISIDVRGMNFVITDGVITHACVPQEEEAMHELGDAPDSTNSHGVPMTAYPTPGPMAVAARYPTVYQIGSPPHGPIHFQPRALAHLGRRVSLENEADIGPDEDGVNNIDPPADQPNRDRYDDGILNLPLVMPHCRQNQFEYVVNAPAAATPAVDLFVNVWCDWNRNGDWDDILRCPSGLIADEWAVQDQLLPAGSLSPGLNVITTPPFTSWHPASRGRSKPMWLRITLSEKPWPFAGAVTPNSGLGGAGPPEGYDYGETEDYRFVPVIEECPSCADLNCDGIVNLPDFAIFAAQWLHACP